MGKLVSKLIVVGRKDGKLIGEPEFGKGRVSFFLIQEEHQDMVSPGEVWDGEFTKIFRSGEDSRGVPIFIHVFRPLRLSMSSSDRSLGFRSARSGRFYNKKVGKVLSSIKRLA